MDASFDADMSYYLKEEFQIHGKVSPIYVVKMYYVNHITKAHACEQPRSLA